MPKVVHGNKVISWTKRVAGYYEAKTNGKRLEVIKVGKSYMVLVSGEKKGTRATLKSARDWAVKLAY